MKEMGLCLLEKWKILSHQCLQEVVCLKEVQDKNQEDSRNSQGEVVKRKTLTWVHLHKFYPQQLVKQKWILLILHKVYILRRLQKVQLLKPQLKSNQKFNKLYRNLKEIKIHLKYRLKTFSWSLQTSQL